MKYIRFEKEGAVKYGILEKGLIHETENRPFGSIKKTGLRFKPGDVRLLAPVTASKIIAVGLNYTDHAKELKMPLPAEPLIFLKPPSSITGPGEAIYYPRESRRVDYEAEMAVVIKKKAYRVPYQEADNYIFGYTCLNDVTARDLQKKDAQWTRSKSFDTFCPVGPYVETEADPSSLKIEAFLNKTPKQSSNTSNMIFGPRRLIEYISGIMTLEAGDIIATGTPAGVGPMVPGDKVEVKIEGLGSLINYVEG